MIGAVHASIGAAIGSFCKKRGTAFVAGVVSHAIADALPHHDYPPKVEVPLMAGAMLLVGKLKGFDSPEFWGALGAIMPDAEHGLCAVGLGDFDHEHFPTHKDKARLHGKDTGERLSQLIVASTATLTLALRKPKES